MAIEKIGIYRKWLEAVPEDEYGNPIPKSHWTKKRRHRWIVRWYGTAGQRYGKVFKTRKEAESYTHQLQARVDIGKADMPQKITLQEFRLEHEHVMKGQVAYATLEDQKRALKLFENFIGAVNLGALLLLIAMFDNVRTSLIDSQFHGISILAVKACLLGSLCNKICYCSEAGILPGECF